MSRGAAVLNLGVQFRRGAVKLFEPITVRGMELKNRIVLPAMIVFRKPSLEKQSPEYVDRERPYYVERAIGGTGTIITGAISATRLTNDEVWGQPGSVAAFVELLRRFVEDVHQHGAKIGPQLWFTNRYPSGTPHPSAMRQKEEWVAPSPRIEPTKPGFHKLYSRPGREARELTPGEIRWIIEQFAAATAKAKEAGLDFIEFHGAHGHLAHEFFSPANNRRNDEYSGDLKRRMRFGLECIESIRRAVGPDYPIFFRLGAEDDCPGGVTLADSTLPSQSNWRGPVSTALTSRWVSVLFGHTDFILALQRRTPWEPMPIWRRLLRRKCMCR